MPAAFSAQRTAKSFAAVIDPSAVHAGVEALARVEPDEDGWLPKRLASVQFPPVPLGYFTVFNFLTLFF
jgi:hypothetical protein